MKEPDDFEEEHFRRRYHRDDNPLKSLKNYVMVFLCGVGVGIGLSSCSPKKYFFASQEQEAAEIKSVLTRHGRVEFAEKQYQALEKGLSDLARKYGWHDGRVWTNWLDILARQGPSVIDGNIKKVIDDTLNPMTPMGKLLNKYRGPKVAPHPSQADEEQLEELYSKYELFQPTIDALMDENHDDELTREERNKGLYKLLHQ